MMRGNNRFSLLVWATTAAALTIASPAAAQRSRPGCAVLCAPSVDLMPALLRSHVFGGPAVQNLTTGATSRVPSLSNFEMIVAVASKTAIPRLSLFGTVQWLPNASAQRNPFTLYAASQLGGSVRANAPTVTLGLSGSVVAAAQTAGLLDVDLDVGDLYSQAARPGDRSAYTHKLELDLVTHWNAFAWTPSRSYVHRLTLFAIADYVATGLPRVGDEVPLGRRFLGDARPTSLVMGLSVPITPEHR
jgi:hypothetical protein